jgi:hypothetical protein
MTLIGVFSSCDATETNSALSLSSSANCLLIVRKLAASRPNSSRRCSKDRGWWPRLPLGHGAHPLVERPHRSADRSHQPDADYRGEQDRDHEAGERGVLRVRDDGPSSGRRAGSSWLPIWRSIAFRLRSTSVIAGPMNRCESVSPSALRFAL